MARVALTVTKITRSGAYLAPTAGTDQGQSFKNDGRTFLEITNGGDAPLDLTIVTTSTVLGLDVDDLAITVAAGAVVKAGPFPPSNFNNAGADAGLAYINFPAASESDLSVAAYSV